MFSIVKVPADNWGKNLRNKSYHRPPSVIDTIMGHRIMVGDGTYQGIIDWFASDEGFSWMGTRDMPYTFLLAPDCDRIGVAQCVNLQTRTPHALQYNRRAIGVGVIGDFRKAAPTRAQREGFIWLSTRLALMLNNAPLVTVHGAIPEATKDKNKLLGGPDECPGEHFHLTWYAARDAVIKQGRVEW